MKNDKSHKLLRALIITAILAAASIVLGKFAAINIGDTIRISFENLPIMLASFLFGPFFGGACGLVADLLGCVLRGYSPIPLITVASVLMGVIPGVLSRCVFKKTNVPYVIAAGLISHVVCSMFVKTVALHVVYMTPYFSLLTTRVPVYLVLGIAEPYLCALLMQRKFVKKEIIF